MIDYLYSIYPDLNWEGLIYFLLFLAGVGLYQWGVATGETRAEQKLKQEGNHGTFNQNRW